MSAEPPTKKQKKDSLLLTTIENYIQNMKNRTRNLQPVLSDEFIKPLPVVKVCVGHIKDPKSLSQVVQILNEKLPLKELQHLKRITKRDVILCPTDHLNGASSIQEFLEYKVHKLKDVFEYFKEVEVPLVAPKVKKQYNSLVWSCNFHPNKYYEKLVGGDFFPPHKLSTHVHYMKMVFEIVKFYEDNSSDTFTDFLLSNNATVVVDPLIDSVVAAAFCNHSHPLQHSAMIAIDNVAKTQGGGVWYGTVPQNKLECAFNGIDSDLLKYLRNNVPNRIGARDMLNIKYASEKDGPYLCTGYDIYMLKEPCIMCAMALIHARAKRIFYCFDNLHYGALNSRMKLQAVPALNHHFEVFTGFL